MPDKGGYSYWMRREDKILIGDFGYDYVVVTESEESKKQALETLNRILDKSGHVEKLAKKQKKKDKRRYFLR